VRWAILWGEDEVLAAKDTLYRCLDRLLVHKRALFDHLRWRWNDLFGVTYEVLLYDLTSTYFESDPPFSEEDKRRYGYSRDHRPDCLQVVIALVVTPEGFPLAYEVLPGNTADSTTLRDFLARIELDYGKAQRIWVMDRGIPTEETLEQMRVSDPPVPVPGRHPQGPFVEARERPAAQTLARGPPGGAGEAAAARRRDVRLRPESRPHCQGARDAQASAQETLGAPEAAVVHDAFA